MVGGCVSGEVDIAHVSAVAVAVVVECRTSRSVGRMQGAQIAGVLTVGEVTLGLDIGLGNWWSDILSKGILSCMKLTDFGVAYLARMATLMDPLTFVP